MDTGDLLQRYLQYTGFVQQHIEGYDYWLTEVAYRTIASRYLRLRDDQISESLRMQPITDDMELSSDPVYRQNWVLTFENLEMRPPDYHPLKSNESLIMTPQLARQEGFTYGSDWYVSMNLRRGGIHGPKIGDPQRILIGNVPLMVKCKFCILHGKTPQELELLGEDPVDPGGYFIIEGSEKVILMQEQLALNRILLMQQKLQDPPVIRIITSTIRGTSMNEIVMRKTQQESRDNNVLVMRLPSINKDVVDNQFNVLRFYRIMGITQPSDMIEYINQFIPPAEQDKCRYKLSRSLIDLQCSLPEPGTNARDNDIEYLAAAIQMTADAANKKKKKKTTIIPGTNPRDISDMEYLATGIQMMADDKTNKLTISGVPDSSAHSTFALKEQAVINLLNTDLFPHLNKLPPVDGESITTYTNRIYQAKIYLLSLMIARYLRHLAGYIPLDDRDSWSNKRLKGAGPMMDQLFRNAWRYMLSAVQGTIDSSSGQIDLKTIQKSFAKDIVTDSYRSSFVTPNWGVKTSIISNNVAQTLVRDSLIATLGHLYTIDVPISRKDRQAEPRLVQQSQFGFVDPIATPEGANTGIIKNLSLTSRISVDHDDTIVIRYLLNGNYVHGLYTPYDVNGGSDKLIIDGKFLGWCSAENTQSFLLAMRRNGSLIVDMSIIRQFDYLYVDMSSSRLLRPLLIVDVQTQELVIISKGLQNAPIAQLEQEGALEYISPWEQEYIKLAITPDDILARLNRIDNAEQEVYDAQRNLDDVLAGQTVKYGDVFLNEHSARMNLEVARNYLNDAKNVLPYTHCELDSISMLGIVSSLIPWPNHNQAPRNTYQVSMGKQAQGIYHRNHNNRYDGSMKMLAYPNKPMVQTEMYDIIGLGDRPAGENVVIAFMAWPYTEEDSFVFKREFLQNGGFRMFKYFVLKTILHGSAEKLARPEIQPEDADRYRYIGTNGLPAIGAYLRPGDCVVAKYVETTSRAQSGVEKRYTSMFMSKGEEGIVDGIKITRSGQDVTIIEVKFRTMRIPQEGDKFAPRNAQKGTIGLVVSATNLPVSSQGIVPDIIVNVHSIPSRMTIEYLMELLSSKHGAMRGVRVNGTAFRPFEMNEMRQTMKEYGMNEFGYENVRSGMTGEEMEALIFMGPVYFQALRHHVKDKIQARGQGPSTSMFHQPTKGRSNGGGLRFGEMERDALASFGATSAILERLRDVSDAYHTVMCQNCGNFAVHRPVEDDYSCPLCESKGLPSRVGKVTIPYVLKLFMNLLGATGIQLKPELWNTEQVNAHVFGRITRMPEDDDEEQEEDIDEIEDEQDEEITGEIFDHDLE